MLWLEFVTPYNYYLLSDDIQITDKEQKRRVRKLKEAAYKVCLGFIQSFWILSMSLDGFGAIRQLINYAHNENSTTQKFRKKNVVINKI